MLDWLPQPDKTARLWLTSQEAASQETFRETFLRLADFGWQEPELRKLGRRFRRGLTQLSGSDATPGLGFTPVKLLVFANHTFKHFADTLTAVGIRDGLAIESTVVEHVNPLQWLNSETSPGRYDFVLFCARLLDSAMGDSFDVDGDGQSETASLLTEQLHVAKTVSQKLGARAIFELVPQEFTSPGGQIDLTLRQSARRKVMAYNLALADAAAAQGHLLLDLPRLIACFGWVKWWPGRYWHVGKIPVSDNCAPFYLSALSRILAATQGRSRRVLITDLDNTLWGGVIGDDGMAGIIVGQGSAVGEAYLAYQRFLIGLKNRGIVLCISSKNEMAAVLGPLNQHEDMLLRERDFTIIKANWQDKATNIKEIAATLNLALDSLVFIDDNPVERKLVREALPMVAVPELPEDRSQWTLLLSAAGYFESASLTKEDTERGRYYAEDAKREQVRSSSTDQEAFLRSLQMQLTVKGFDDVGRKRIAQLIGKSNQFNLTTRRYSEVEVAFLQADPGSVSLQARLVDMFGDNGIISCVIGSVVGNSLVIDLWVMSCRVIGRMVEQAMLLRLVREARRKNLKEIVGVYLESPKNAMVRDHYEKLGFNSKSTSNGRHEWILRISEFKQPTLPFALIVEDE
jgi:FkbH-like protein